MGDAKSVSAGPSQMIPELFDQDNFSETEIKYKLASAEEPRVKAMIQTHFPENKVVEVSQLDRKEINSANFQVLIDSPSQEQRRVLLREYKTLSDKEHIEFYLDFVDQLRELGAQVPHCVRNKNGGLTNELKGTRYSVFEFIDSKYFSPNEEGLASVAREIGKIHGAFQNISHKYQDKIEILSKQGATFFNSVPSVRVEDLRLIAEAIEAKTEKSDIDRMVASKMPQYLKTAEAIEAMQNKKNNLPKRIFHSDLHPHNILMDRNGDSVTAIIDFDSMRVQEGGEALDVAYAIYRLGKQFLVSGDRSPDAMKQRAVHVRDVFLTAYDEHQELSVEELDILPLLCKEEMMKKLLYLLNGSYLGGKTQWLHELPKFIPAIDEINYFWPEAR